jgi:hypothetical protein
MRRVGEAYPERKERSLKRIVKRCAGLDVHKASITACVRIATAKKNKDDEEPHQEIRKFKTTTRGLLQLRDWLVAFEVELVGMEATGVYWRSQSTMCWRTTSSAGC